MSITLSDRQAIREAFGFSCGYCGVSESDIGGQLEIDHYRPVTKGGNDQLNNLVYACVHCNRFKGNYWPDDNDPQSFYLLHPGEDDPSLHFRLTASGRLEGSTPRGCIMPPVFWTKKEAVLSSKTSYEKEIFTPIQGKSRAGDFVRGKKHQPTLQ